MQKRRNIVPIFRGNIGRLRKVLYNLGEDHETIIFNDNRKNYRRLKIYMMPKKVPISILFTNIINEFKNELIEIQIYEFEKWHYKRKSLCVYLKN